MRLGTNSSFQPNVPRKVFQWIKRPSVAGKPHEVVVPREFESSFALGTTSAAFCILAAHRKFNFGPAVCKSAVYSYRDRSDFRRHTRSGCYRAIARHRYSLSLDELDRPIRQV